MSTRKLTYFEWNGLGEPIRYIMLYTGKKFEDVRVELKNWPDEGLIATLPFGKLPLYEENGKTLHQSRAILRYIAVGTELLPSDPWEQAILDATAHTAYDFLFNNVLKSIFEFDPVRKEEARKEFYEETLDYYMSRFQKQLKENNGHFGGKLTWVDFFFAGIIECANSYLNEVIEKNYPLIRELIKKIHSLPRIKEYVEHRKPYYPHHLDYMKNNK